MGPRKIGCREKEGVGVQACYRALELRGQSGLRITVGFLEEGFERGELESPVLEQRRSGRWEGSISDPALQFTKISCVRLFGAH